MKALRGLLPLCLLVACSLAVQAAPRPGSWTFSPVFGISQPQLTTLRQGVFLAPFRGRAQITTALPEDVQGEATYPEVDFVFYNPLPDFSMGPEAGLEFRRYVNPRHDFVLGMASWEVSSKSAIQVVFPIQGAPDNLADYERRGSFSYTQYYLGWRSYLRKRPKLSNLYLGLTLHEIFDVDYKEEHVFSFLSGPPAGFRRIAVYRSQTTGILALQAGVGLEINFNDRIALALESAYYKSLRRAPMKGLSGRYDFNDGDRITSGLDPLGVNRENGQTYYLDSDGETTRPFLLEFNGWKVVAKISIEF